MGEGSGVFEEEVAIVSRADGLDCAISAAACSRLTLGIEEISNAVE